MPRKFGHRIYAGLGGLAGRILKKDRERAVDNLGLAFPGTNRMFREAITTAMFKNIGRNIYDFLKMEGASAARLASMVDGVEGMEHYEKAAAAGNGVIVITGHIGCWELMPPYFFSLGHKVTVIARRMKVSRLNDELVKIRASVGVVTVDRDSNAREMIKPLRRGEILGVLIDQHTNVSGTYVPFFNKPAYTPTGVAKLSCLTGAPIVPMADFLKSNGKHVIQVLPPILPPEKIHNKKETVEQITAECSLAIEQLIRLDPKQWVWFHHRWREPQTNELSDIEYASNA